MTTVDVLFSLFGVIAAGSAVLAVATRQLVHAALWLTVAMAALSGCYLVLGAELVALVQLLVYVGAIVVLVLFAVMLTRSPLGKSNDHSVGVVRQVVGFITAAATSALLLAAFLAAFGTRQVAIDSAPTVDLATNLFSRFTWPFEVLSLVLLVALVGALAMLKAPRTSAETTGGSRAVTSAAPTAASAPADTEPAPAEAQTASNGAEASPGNGVKTGAAHGDSHRAEGGSSERSGEVR